MEGLKRLCSGMFAVLAMMALSGLWSEAEAETCGTTWTTACASVSVLSNGNTLVLGVSNVSTGDSENSLFSWLQVDVDPDEAAFDLAGSKVWANCGDGFDASSMAFADHCDDISEHWGYSVNNQGSIEWDAGLQSDEGNDGIITESGTCNGDCWTGPVYFEMAFDQDVDFQLWSIQARRLGEDGEESEWIQVPEPITTTMVGIGVAGWLGVGMRRRREKALEEGDNLA